MTTSDTIGRVARPRGVLSNGQRFRLDLALGQAEAARKKAREVVVAILAEGASFNEVSKATGLSKDTLQRWKREAGK